MYTGELHKKSFVERVFSYMKENQQKFGSYKKSSGFLQLALQEVDNCFVYNYSDLFSAVKCRNMSSKMMNYLLQKNNFLYSLSHTSKGSFKTNAPPSFVWDIVRCWFTYCFPQDPPSLSSPFSNILLHKPLHSFDFDEAHKEAKNLPKLKGLFFENPPNWGPKPKAQPTPKRKRDSEENK